MGSLVASRTRLRGGSAPPWLRASAPSSVKWGHRTCTAETSAGGGWCVSQPWPGAAPRTRLERRRRDRWRKLRDRERAHASSRRHGGRKSEASLTRPVRGRQGPSGTFGGRCVSCLFRLLKAPVSLAGGRTLLCPHSEQDSSFPSRLCPHVPSCDPNPPASLFCKDPWDDTRPTWESQAHLPAADP